VARPMIIRQELRQGLRYMSTIQNQPKPD